MTRLGLGLAAVPLSAALLSAQPAPQAAAFDLTHTLRAASAWTARFTQNLSGLLFREKFLQKVQGGRPGELRIGTLHTEANVFLLHTPATGSLVLFRDVYRANGRDITNHTERLETLLTNGSDRAVEQATRLTNASAAFNLGSVNRNVNIPTMGLRYLEAGIVGGVRFRMTGRETVQGLPARGRFWIHPESGSVPRAHVDFPGVDVDGRVEIDLMMHPQLAAWVPKEMTEVWRASGQRISGLAHYDRYERLTVSTGEVIKK